jgi:hypothetical protein
MPVVPTSRLPTVRSRPIQATRRTATGATSEAFGGISAKAKAQQASAIKSASQGQLTEATNLARAGAIEGAGLDNLGRGVTSAGRSAKEIEISKQAEKSNLLNLKLKYQAEDNEREAKTLDTQYRAGVGALAQGDGSAENPGFMNLTGQLALNNREDYEEGLKSLRTKLLDKSTNSRVRDTFDHSSLGVMEDALIRSSSHTAKERKKANIRASQARMITLKEGAIGKPGTISDVADSLEGELLDQQSQTGVSDEVLKVQSAQELGDLVNGAVDYALASQNVSGAEAILTEHTDDLLPTDRSKALKSIVDASGWITAAVKEAADPVITALENGGDLNPEAVSQVRNSFATVRKGSDRDKLIRRLGKAMRRNTVIRQFQDLPTPKKGEYINTLVNNPAAAGVDHVLVQKLKDLNGAYRASVADSVNLFAGLVSGGNKVSAKMFSKAQADISRMSDGPQKERLNDVLTQAWGDFNSADTEAKDTGDMTARGKKALGIREATPTSGDQARQNSILMAQFKEADAIQRAKEKDVLRGALFSASNTQSRLKQKGFFVAPEAIADTMASLESLGHYDEAKNALLSFKATVSKYNARFKIANPTGVPIVNAADVDDAEAARDWGVTLKTSITKGNYWQTMSGLNVLKATPVNPLDPESLRLRGLQHKVQMEKDGPNVPMMDKLTMKSIVQAMKGTSTTGATVSPQTAADMADNMVKAWGDTRVKTIFRDMVKSDPEVAIAFSRQMEGDQEVALTIFTGLQLEQGEGKITSTLSAKERELTATETLNKGFQTGVSPLVLTRYTQAANAVFAAWVAGDSSKDTADDYEAAVRFVSRGGPISVNGSTIMAPNRGIAGGDVDRVLFGGAFQEQHFKQFGNGEPFTISEHGTMERLSLTDLHRMSIQTYEEGKVIFVGVGSDGIPRAAASGELVNGQPQPYIMNLDDVMAAGLIAPPLTQPEGSTIIPGQAGALFGAGGFAERQNTKLGQE